MPNICNSYVTKNVKICSQMARYVAKMLKYVEGLYFHSDLVWKTIEANRLSHVSQDVFVLAEWAFDIKGANCMRATSCTIIPWGRSSSYSSMTAKICCRVLRPRFFFHSTSAFLCLQHLPKLPRNLLNFFLQSFQKLGPFLLNNFLCDLLHKMSTEEEKGIVVLVAKCTMHITFCVHGVQKGSEVPGR